jgi:hypothetical protein
MHSFVHLRTSLSMTVIYFLNEKFWEELISYFSLMTHVQHRKRHVKQFFCLKFEFFTAVTMRNAAFWDVALYGSCHNLRFRGTYRLHLERRKALVVGFSTFTDFFYPEDVVEKFLRNVGCYKTYKAPHFR